MAKTKKKIILDKVKNGWECHEKSVGCETNYFFLNRHEGIKAVIKELLDVMSPGGDMVTITSRSIIKDIYKELNKAKETE